MSSRITLGPAGSIISKVFETSLSHEAAKKSGYVWKPCTGLESNFLSFPFSSLNLKKLIILFFFGWSMQQSRSTELSEEYPSTDTKAKFQLDILVLPEGVLLRWMRLGVQTSKHDSLMPWEEKKKKRKKRAGHDSFRLIHLWISSLKGMAAGSLDSLDYSGLN